MYPGRFLQAMSPPYIRENVMFSHASTDTRAYTPSLYGPREKTESSCGVWPVLLRPSLSDSLVHTDTTHCSVLTAAAALHEET